MAEISVIIPAYNMAEFIQQTIDSVLVQSYKNFEIVVVDDGSTDDTKKLVCSISDKRVKYLHKQNGGVGSARNLGIFNSTGKYIAFLDADDLWPENYLELLYNTCEKKPQYGLAYTNFVDIDKNGKQSIAIKPNQYFSGNITKNFYDKMPIIPPSASFIRKDVLKNLYFDEALISSEDIDFFLRLSLRTKFVFLPDIYVTRKLRENSLSANAKLSLNTILVLERFYSEFGGNKTVSKKKYLRKMSRKYQSLAKKFLSRKNKKAALELYKKSIRYWLRKDNIKEFIKALFLKSKNDPEPNWKMPLPLADKIVVKSIKV